MARPLLNHLFPTVIANIIMEHSCPFCGEFNEACDHCNIGSANEIANFDDTFNPLWRIANNTVLCNYNIGLCNNAVSSAELKKDIRLHGNGFFCKYHVHECDDFETCHQCFGVLCYICNVCQCLPKT
jgi:hypothetical protein